MSEYIKCPNCNGTGELSNGKECEVCDGGMKINDKELSELITALRNDSYREGMNDQKLEHVSEPVMTSNAPDSLRKAYAVGIPAEVLLQDDIKRQLQATNTNQGKGN